MTHEEDKDPDTEIKAIRMSLAGMAREIHNLRQEVTELESMRQMVADMHEALMTPQIGQDRGLLYQIAQMLEEWKRHKCAFRTVIWLAGAVVTMAAAAAAMKIGIWDGDAK